MTTTYVASRLIPRKEYSLHVHIQLITATVKHIVATAQKRGAILIFLSGVQEIRQCMEKLRGVANSKIFPLHANLTSDEQRRVFAPTTEWKIIVSTNVAEVGVSRNTLSICAHCVW